MILSKHTILKRLQKPVDDPSSLVITPLLSPHWDSDSLDVRLGTSFILARSDRLPANVPGHGHGREFQRHIHVPLGRSIVVPGHHTVLASTLEFLKMPCDVSAMVLTKSSWARTFMTVEAAPWVHPCYRGCLTLEIANLSETSLTLYSGLRVAQLVFVKVDSAAEEEEKLQGKYLGPVKPEVPRFKEPETTLADELGLPKGHFVGVWDNTREQTDS